MRLRSQAIRVYKYTEIQGPGFQRNYIITGDKTKLFTWHVISIIAENYTACSSQDHLRTMKVYNIRPSQICYLRFLVFFRPLSGVHLFQSNQRFEAIEFVDRHVSEKL